MTEFAASETIKIRQRVTVPPIFKAEKFRKQLQNHALDPFAVEFMLSFAKYLQSRTHAVK